MLRVRIWNHDTVCLSTNRSITVNLNTIFFCICLQAYPIFGSHCTRSQPNGTAEQREFWVYISFMRQGWPRNSFHPRNESFHSQKWDIPRQKLENGYIYVEIFDGDPDLAAATVCAQIFDEDLNVCCQLWLSIFNYLQVCMCVLKWQYHINATQPSKTNEQKSKWYNPNGNSSNAKNISDIRADSPLPVGFIHE